MTAPLTVVVVDDSAVQRRFLRGALDAAADFDVVGEARNGREAVALVERLRPRAVVMDLDLPVMGGVEAIERIMAGCPTPILVYSAFVAGAGSANALAALGAGAVDILAKPGPADAGTLDEYAETLRRRLRTVARIRVITHPRGRLRASGAFTGAVPVLAGVDGRRPLRPPVDPAARAGVRLVVIGASTGGPHAVLAVLAALPADFAPAVLVVQHMAAGFLDGLAGWLDELVPLPVRVGVAGRRLTPGTVTVAPGGKNVLVQDIGLDVVVTPPEPGQFHLPGIDATMRSVASALGPAAVGVLLTGMGRDGAAGLLEMRRRGAATIGQDEASCVVYGMPAAAAALHALERVLPLAEIGPAVRALAGVPASVLP